MLEFGCSVNTINRNSTWNSTAAKVPAQLFPETWVTPKTAGLASEFRELKEGSLCPRREPHGKTRTQSRQIKEREAVDPQSRAHSGDITK